MLRRAIDRLVVNGNLRVNADFEVVTSIAVGGLGVIDTQPGSTFTLPPSVTLDGQLVPGGTVVADGNTVIEGVGEYLNDGLLRKTGAGTLTLADTVEWNTFWNSEVVVEQGRVEILGSLLASSGSYQVAAGTELVIVDDFGPGPGSRLATEIVGPSSDPVNYGRILVGGNFSYEPNAPVPGPGELELTADFSGLHPHRSRRVCARLVRRRLHRRRNRPGERSVLRRDEPRAARRRPDRARAQPAARREQDHAPWHGKQPRLRHDGRRRR